MLHDTQKILLKRLYLRNHQRYGELTHGYDYEDNVAFHLKQLLEKGFIIKGDGIYSLTTSGLQEVAGYNLPDLTEAGVKTFFVGLLINYQDKYLIKQHPQAKENFYNFPSRKPIFGESIETALTKTLSKYTGLETQPENFSFLSLHLKTIKTSENEVLFDDAFAIYQITLTPSQYAQIKLTNNAVWVAKNELVQLPYRWPELDICILKEDKTPYMAYDFVSDYILD